MKIAFTKMHGAGNDFVVIDATVTPFTLSAAQLRRLADRHVGVGCDQILVVERAQSAADFRYRIFNADGGEVEQCGNGARCFVKFVFDRGFTQQREIRVETLSGLITLRREDDGQVTVNMGAPVFDATRIPFQPADAADAHALLHRLTLDSGDRVEVSVLSMGNPHAVCVVADVETAPVASHGPQMEHHAQFPRRVNAGFMQIVNRNHLRLRVFERGAGETLSCGTGACAAAVAGIRLGHLESPVQVDTRGGRLTIQWAGGDNPVLLTGPAATVFEGSIEL
jgi:diaminopimelate epimerase